MTFKDVCNIIWQTYTNVTVAPAASGFSVKDRGVGVIQNKDKDCYSERCAHLIHLSWQIPKLY